MKVYARQVDPEHQVSPLYYDGMPDDIVFKGNRNYLEHMTEEYKTFKFNIDDVINEYELIGTDNGRYKNVTELVLDRLPPKHKKSYTADEISQWEEIINNYSQYNPYTTLALSLMTGHKYKITCIKGCCQGDWQDIFYPSDVYSDDDIKVLEMNYFNLGTEWIVHDEKTEPSCPEDISGYSIYCYSWNDDGIKKEIAQAQGCKPEDVVLYVFDGYIKVPKYKMI